jgi:hypothetical protein
MFLVAHRGSRRRIAVGAVGALGAIRFVLHRNRRPSRWVRVAIGLATEVEAVVM